ncbi:MAG: hypothetical protein ABIH49_00385 [archaeon]
MKTDSIQVQSIAEKFAKGKRFKSQGIEGDFQMIDAVAGRVVHEKRTYIARTNEEFYEMALMNGLTEIPGYLLN